MIRVIEFTVERKDYKIITREHQKLITTKTKTISATTPLTAAIIAGMPGDYRFYRIDEENRYIYSQPGFSYEPGELYAVFLVKIEKEEPLIRAATALKKGDKILKNGSYFELTEDPRWFGGHVIIKGRNFEGQFLPENIFYLRRPGVYSWYKEKRLYAVRHGDGTIEYFRGHKSAGNYAGEFGLEVVRLGVEIKREAKVS